MPCSAAMASPPPPLLAAKVSNQSPIPLQCCHEAPRPKHDLFAPPPPTFPLSLAPPYLETMGDLIEVAMARATSQLKRSNEDAIVQLRHLDGDGDNRFTMSAVTQHLDEGEKGPDVLGDMGPRGGQRLRRGGI
ncbi:hypothetical protein NL676_008423 [Syzygium grande]|nr:hypothetical protein NL676_008423 [Syzygium grande]